MNDWSSRGDHRQDLGDLLSTLDLLHLPSSHPSSFVFFHPSSSSFLHTLFPLSAHPTARLVTFTSPCLFIDVSRTHKALFSYIYNPLTFSFIIPSPSLPRSSEVLQLGWLATELADLLQWLPHFKIEVILSIRHFTNSLTSRSFVWVGLVRDSS